MRTIIENIFILAAIQGTLLAILLLFRKQNKTANRILSVMIFLLSIDLISQYLFITRFYIEHPSTFGATFAFPLLYGPLFYLYTLFLLKEKRRFRIVYLLHFLPFILTHLYLSPFYFLSPADKLNTINYYLKELQPDLFVIAILKPVSGILYSIISLRVLFAFRKSAMNTQSNLDKIKFNWLRYLFVGTAVIWCVVVITMLVAMLSPESKEEYPGVIYFFISVFIYSIGYGALNQPEVFNLTEERADTKYEKSSLKEEDIEKIKTVLLECLDKKKPYLNGKLTLANLAEELNISPHNLSETINTGFSKNFYDFINAYRVEEFKARINKPEFSGYSILAVALESGFSSKSSFNTIFKKHTNQTPSEFRNSIS